ncbi:WD-REPEATS-REGION domain-containing protein [Aphelenchoides fujianensis]|nr:WD-REPEATS-REGION domain-containing protein [Aphelenchoides fujianensis]
MSSMLNSSAVIESTSSPIEGGILCPRRRYAFLYNPLERVSFDDYQKKSFTDIGSSIMSIGPQLCGATDRLLRARRKIREIYEQDGFVTDICWNPVNPNVFASIGTDNSIRTWDIRTHPAQTLQLRRQRRYKCVVYSPDSNFLGFGGDQIELVDLTNPRNTIQISAPSPVVGLRFNPVEYLLATSGEDRVVRFLDVDTHECVSQSLPAATVVKSFEFDQDGKMLIASTGTSINAFGWEPFEVVGRIDLADTSSLLEEFDGRRCSAEWTNTPLGPPDFSPDEECAVSTDSAIGTVRSIDAAAVRHRQNSTGSGVLAQSMSGSCCSNQTSTSAASSSGKKTPVENAKPVAQRRASGSENLAVKRTPAGRTRSTSRQTLPAKEERAGLTNRTPSVEFLYVSLGESSAQRPKTLKGGGSTRTLGSQPPTPVDEKPPAHATAKRNGSVDSTASSNYVAEKHSSALDEASRMKGSHMFARLLRAYREHPAAYSLKFAARVLPSLRGLLTHRNAEYVNLALATLGTILDEFAQPIQHALAANGSIGVDVAAEERHALSVACKQALTELYLNSSFITSRLDQSQTDLFNSLLPMIESMVDT